MTKMFGRETQKDDARGLLSHDTLGDDDVVWEHEHNSVRSDKNTTASMSEVWDQDPLSETTDHNPSSSSAGGYAPPDPPTLPEDYGEAAHELEAEFRRIFSPVSLPQINAIQFCVRKLLNCQKRPRKTSREGAILPGP